MAAKSYAFEITADAHLVSPAQDSCATNGRRLPTVHDGHLPGVQPLRARIGEFEVDLRTGELRAGATTVRLQEQPFQILRILLGHDGEIVTRDEIQQTLWADGTVVDFDHGINAAIKKLRKGFADSADDPQYVETVARRGYRLMRPVEWSHRVEAVPSPLDAVNAAEGGTTKRHPPTAFAGRRLGPDPSPRASRRSQPRAGHQFKAAMQHRKLEDRLLFLERLVLARVRGLRRRQRCMFRLQTAAQKFEPPARRRERERTGDGTPSRDFRKSSVESEFRAEDRSRRKGRPQPLMDRKRKEAI